MCCVVAVEVGLPPSPGVSRGRLRYSGNIYPNQSGKERIHSKLLAQTVYIQCTIYNADFLYLAPAVTIKKCVVILTFISLISPYRLNKVNFGR